MPSTIRSRPIDLAAVLEPAGRAIGPHPVAGFYAQTGCRVTHPSELATLVAQRTTLPAADMAALCRWLEATAGQAGVSVEAFVAELGKVA